MSQSENNFSIDISPEASALRIFQSLNFTPWFALGEFVDNSITSVLKGLKKGVKVAPDYKLKVDVEFIKDRNGVASKDTIRVKDNAFGIPEGELKNRALKVGVPPIDTEIGLSRHGVGMKAAAFWFGSNIRIATFPIEENGYGYVLSIEISPEKDINPDVIVRRVRFDDESIAELNLPYGFHGTIIDISGLKNELPSTGVTRKKIKAYLPSIYRSFVGEWTSSPDGLNRIVEPIQDIDNGLIPVELNLRVFDKDGKLKLTEDEKSTYSELNKNNEVFKSFGDIEKDAYSTRLAYKEPELWRGDYWNDIHAPIENCPPNTDPQDPLLWKRAFTIEVNGKIITGWYGLLKTLSRNAGFYLHYRGKGISGIVEAVEEKKTKSKSNDTVYSEDEDSTISSMTSAAIGYRPDSIFGQTGSNRSNGITGSIDMSAFGKSITTDQLQWTPNEEAIFIKKLKDDMEKLPDRVAPQGSSEIQPNFIRMADKMRRLKANAEKKNESTALEENQNEINGRIDPSKTLEPKSAEDVANEHGLPKLPEPTVSDSAGEEEPTAAYHIGKYKGRWNSEHEFRVYFVSAPESEDFVEINTIETSTHIVKINESHVGVEPYLRNADAKKMLFQLVLSYAMAEAFTKLDGKESIRIRWQEMLSRLVGK